jgi:insulysin
MSRLWYKPDTTFRTPKAHIYLHFSCPETNYSAEASLLTDIFAKLLMDHLNEYGKCSLQHT